MKILIIALSGIGDALMFTPALQQIKKHIPTSIIDALVMYKGVEDIYSRTGLINKVYYHDFLNSSPFSSLRFVLSFRKKYEISLNVYPSNRIEYNVIQFLIGAKKRGGVNYKRMNFRNLSFLNTHKINEDDNRHNVVHNLMMVQNVFNFSDEELPDLLFPLSEEDNDAAPESIPDFYKKTNKKIIGFHPGCSTLKNHEKRRWEPEKFIQLAKNLINDYNSVVLVLGGPDENELKEKIVNEVNSEFCSSVNTKNLAQSAAVIKQCDLFITNDSSLMHIAAAMKRKTIALIGPTNESYIHPWNTEYKIVSLRLDCSPCFFYSPKPLSCSREDVKFKCIKELQVENVLSEVKKMI